jgi:hypothetical protein
LLTKSALQLVTLCIEGYYLSRASFNTYQVSFS